jgi:hypothetical protein
VLSSTPGEYRTVLADNLRHPAIAILRREHASIELPWRHWLCGTPAYHRRGRAAGGHARSRIESARDESRAATRAEPNAALLPWHALRTAALVFLLSLAIGPVGLGRGLPERPVR